MFSKFLDFVNMFVLASSFTDFSIKRPSLTSFPTRFAWNLQALGCYTRSSTKNILWNQCSLMKSFSCNDELPRGLEAGQQNSQLLRQSLKWQLKSTDSRSEHGKGRSFRQLTCLRGQRWSELCCEVGEIARWERAFPFSSSNFRFCCGVVLFLCFQLC